MKTHFAREAQSIFFTIMWLTLGFERRKPSGVDKDFKQEIIMPKRGRERTATMSHVKKDVA